MKVVAGRAICALVLVAAVVVASDSTADVCVYKPPKIRRVCGVIVDPSGAPLRDATVTVLKGGTTVKALTTDDTGEFDFDVMQPGKYELDASLAGFQHARYQLTLSKPTHSCRHALRVQMAVGSIHCEGDGIRVTEQPLSRKR